MVHLSFLVLSAYILNMDLFQIYNNSSLTECQFETVQDPYLPGHLLLEQYQVMDSSFTFALTKFFIGCACWKDYPYGLQNHAYALW